MLTNPGARAEVAYAKGINNIKAGVVFEHTLLTEDEDNSSWGCLIPTPTPFV